MKYFGCGRINIDNRKTKTKKFVVTSQTDLINIILPHFNKFSLQTSKQLNYLDFSKAVELVNSKTTSSIIEQVKLLKNNMNKARSFEDKFNFCNSSNIILQPNWVQGFIDGEGSFQCDITEGKSNGNTYTTISPSLQIKQNNHDVAVLAAIKAFFGKGYLKPKYNTTSLEEVLKLSRTTTILWIRQSDIVINFIDNYPLFTTKRLDYFDWKEIISLKDSKAYTTEEGLNKIKQLKLGMNSGRAQHKQNE